MSTKLVHRCGNCGTAWSMGRGTLSHVRVCDNPESKHYKHTRMPCSDTCAAWSPNAVERLKEIAR